MSVFFIKLCFVAVGTEQDARHPFRGFSHLFTDCFQINARTTFDNQFIMNVSDDEAVPESFHCIAKDVAADSLHDILNELRSVGFNALDWY